MDRKETAFPGIEDAPGDRFGIETRPAEPVDRTAAGDECNGAGAADHRVVGNRDVSLYRFRHRRNSARVPAARAMPPAIAAAFHMAFFSSAAGSSTQARSGKGPVGLA